METIFHVDCSEGKEGKRNIWNLCFQTSANIAIAIHCPWKQSMWSENREIEGKCQQLCRITFTESHKVREDVHRICSPNPIPCIHPLKALRCYVHMRFRLTLSLIFGSSQITEKYSTAMWIFGSSQMWKVVSGVSQLTNYKFLHQPIDASNPNNPPRCIYKHQY